MATVEIPIPLKENSPFLEGEIDHLEKELGIRNKEDRLIESSLFVDKKFMDVAVITGNTARPERLFGDEAWADYLEARKATKRYGAQALTPDFIIELHNILTKRSGQTSSEIRSGDVVAADYKDPSKGVTYTEEQVSNIKGNPYLAFRRTSLEENETTGLIVYPNATDETDTQKMVMKMMEDLCRWFNREKAKESYDSYEIAALLQRKLVSIHPFYDRNGTLSRLLMNWSLENDGEFPSMLDNPNDDILNSERGWISEVRKGSKSFHEMKKRQLQMRQMGIEDDAELLGVSQEQAFFEYIFRYLSKKPPLSSHGERMDHQEYDHFIALFLSELREFNSLLKATSKIDDPKNKNESFEITQGGLISKAFMKFTENASFSLNQSMKRFFTDIEVYRGGVTEDDLDDAKLCDMFLHFVGVSADYRALTNFSLPATSLRRVYAGSVAESMDYYNKMVAAFFFKNRHSDKSNPYADDPSIKDLNATIGEHVSTSGIWKSPFASTSVDINVSRGWATIGGRHFNGILIRANAPKEGIILSFGKGLPNVDKGLQHEKEVLLAGGLSPNSIFEIDVFNRNGTGQMPDLIAKKIEADGTTQIEIEDRRGELVKRRTYRFDSQNGRFELVSDITTTIPVERPQETKATFKGTLNENNENALIQQMLELATPFKSKSHLAEYNPILNSIISSEDIFKLEFSKKLIASQYLKVPKINNSKIIKSNFEIK